MREIVIRIKDVTQILDLIHLIEMFINNLETVRVDYRPIFRKGEEDNVAKINMSKEKKDPMIIMIIKTVSSK